MVRAKPTTTVLVPVLADKVAGPHPDPEPCVPADYVEQRETPTVRLAAVWFATDESDYVVGTTLFIDAGMTHKLGFTTDG
jgi:glucose 1-dehydrogenase